MTHNVPQKQGHPDELVREIHAVISRDISHPSEGKNQPSPNLPDMLKRQAI